MAKQQEAAASGAVMAGSEGKRGLDLDAKLVRRHLGPVMLAMNDEASGMNRHQLVERGPDPVPGLDGIEANGSRPLVARGGRDQLADRGLIGRVRKIERHVPVSAGPLKGSDRGFALVEAFRQKIGDAAGSLLVADGKRGAVG